MLVYWLLFAYFAVGDLLQRADPRAARAGDFGGAPHTVSVFLIFGAAAIALLVGMRYRVGGDWGAYEKMFSFVRYADLELLLQRGDPPNQLLNWAVERAGGDIRLVNLVCGAIFSWGLLRLARARTDAWLATLIAISYRVVVVALPGTVVSPPLGRRAVVLYSFLVLFAWLIYAAHANYGVRYRIYPW